MLYPHAYYAGPSLFGGFLALVFWIIIIALIVSIIRHAGHGHYWHSHHDHPHWRDHAPQDPLTIAKLRYAKGEITKAELDQIKKDLA